MKRSLSRSEAFEKLRRFMSDRRARELALKMQKVHSNPKAFLAMIASNKVMSDESKIQALKNYIRKHGRRSSTIN